VSFFLLSLFNEGGFVFLFFFFLCFFCGKFSVGNFYWSVGNCWSELTGELSWHDCLTGTLELSGLRRQRYRTFVLYRVEYSSFLCFSLLQLTIDGLPTFTSEVLNSLTLQSVVSSLYFFNFFLICC
jgi:hypothetical protein